MELAEALLISLYITGGASRAQYNWNLILFFIHMFLSDTIPTRPYKFVATPFGPWCHKVKKEIEYLESKEYITRVYNDLAYRTEIDELITEEFFDEVISYRITEKGRKHVEHIAKTYTIDISSYNIELFLCMFEQDIDYLIELVKHNFPDMIKLKKCKKNKKQGFTKEVE
jgi:hypothetical protein